MTSSSFGPVLLDTDVLICLLKLRRTGLLRKIPCFEFQITEVNESEVIREPETLVLQGAIQAGHLAVSPLVDLQGLNLMAQLQDQIDDGEAATIAQAFISEGRIVMHDKVGRRVAAKLLGSNRVHRLEDVVVEAVRRRLLTLEEADGFRARLQEMSDYGMIRINESFAEVIDSADFGLLKESKSQE